MKRNGPSSLSDTFAIVLCVTFTLLCLGAVGRPGRWHAKRLLCLANLRQLGTAWQQYSNDNHGYLVNGDTGEYTWKKSPWVLKDWDYSFTSAQRLAAIQQGALFPYVEQVEIYQCPHDKGVAHRSYSVVDSMNVRWPGPIHEGQMYQHVSEIPYPEERTVFIDDMGSVGNSLGGWSIFPDESSWWDIPPSRHEGGVTWSFADGHVAYWKWEDPRTLTVESNFTEIQPGNPDIERAAHAVWGGYFSR